MVQHNNPDISCQPSGFPTAESALENFGIKYLFPYQRLVISNILEAGKSLNESAGTDCRTDEGEMRDFPAKQIVILPTGAGKSLCFMLPALMLEGPTIVIFPLLSLIADQLRRCNEAGIEAAALTGGQSSEERATLFRRVRSGKTRMILTNPEMLISPGVIPKLKECGFSHLVFDEVHTVSEWGDSFRPAYLEAGNTYRKAEIPIITAFTATASEGVLSRVKEVLFPGENPAVVTANPDRPNISYTVLPSLSKINSLQLLLGREDSSDRYRPSALVKRPALVFCGRRRTAERTALELRMRLGESEIFFYHAGLEKDEKSKVEEWFFNSTDGILCSTTAYGMGVDKSGIRTVIHRDLSPSVEAYLQESGRAGRDREPAEAILLFSPEDRLSSEDPRYRALLEFAECSDECRRKNLLTLLGAETDFCHGCDVCRKTVESRAPWENEAKSFIRRHRRTFSLSAAAEILARKYPLLLEEDAAEVLDGLIDAGELRIIKHWPWKGLLSG